MPKIYCINLFITKKRNALLTYDLSALLNTVKIGNKKTLIAFTFTTILMLTILINANTLSVNAAKDFTADASLLQYEWPQYDGDQYAHRFNKGPGPEAPDIAWSTTINQAGADTVVAFNGKVFLESNQYTNAFDPFTGELLWSTRAPPNSNLVSFGSGPFKISDNTVVQYVHYPPTAERPYIYQGFQCMDSETGEVLWVSDPFPGGTDDRQGLYIDDLHYYITYGSDENNYAGLFYAWDFSDPSKPPVKKWTFNNEGSGGFGGHTLPAYGDGKIFFGAYTGHIICIDAITTDIIWDREVKAASTYGGCYYEGKYYHGVQGNYLYCFDADTGDILWVYNPETLWGYFGQAPAAAYGIIYIPNHDGYTYAVDANKGTLVWKYLANVPVPGQGYAGYPNIADGKIYHQTSQATYADYLTGLPNDAEYACLDAYTGEVIWKIDWALQGAGRVHCIAYGAVFWHQRTGNATTLYCVATEPWTQWRADPSRSGHGQYGPNTMRLKWSYETEGNILSSACAANGKIYFGSCDKNIYCLDANSGDLNWKFATGARIYSSPAVVDGKVYTGGDDGYVYCLEADIGTQKWQTYVGYIQPVEQGRGIFRSSPAVVDGRVYVGSLDFNLYCLDANTGDILWKFYTGEAIFSSPAVADGMVYISSRNGTLYKLDATSGNMIWKWAEPIHGWELRSTPTIAGDKLFIGSADFYSESGNSTSYYCIDTNTGEMIWRFECMAGQHAAHSPLYVDDKVYLYEFFFVDCVNATTGEKPPIWQLWVTRESISSISYADGKIYVATTLPAIYAINATTGDKISFVDTQMDLKNPMGDIFATPTIYAGKLYVGTFDFKMYCFEEAWPTEGTTYYGSEVSPSLTPQFAAKPSPADQAAEFAFPLEAVYAIAVIIIIAGVAAVAILLRRRK